jgi:Chaperone for flagella basal body P-ring formation
MTRYQSIAILILSVLAVPAVAAPPREAITTAQVAAAMNAKGMNVSPLQVTLLADVVARTSTPRLQVESMERWGNDRMRVRLDCADPSDCVPFIVAVRCSPQSNLRPVADTERSSAVMAPPRPEVNSVVVRAGAPVILLLDGGRVHIRLTVVCLESGAAGQTIHVASKDHRQTYTAVVVDSTTVRASL